MPEISKQSGDGTWITLPEAAVLLGISRQTVAKLAATKRLKSLEAGGRLFIDRESAKAAVGTLRLVRRGMRGNRKAG